MTRYRLFIIFLLVALLSSVPVNMARAQDTGTLVTGTLRSLALETDPDTKVTTVLVYLVDGTGQTLKARLSLETAITLLLVIPNDELIDQDLVIPDPVDPAIELASGTVKALEFVTDPATSETSLSVTLLLPLPPDAPPDALREEQVVPLALEQAITLGLVVTDADLVGTPITVEASLILESETYSEKISKLAGYFASLGLTPEQLAAYEEEFGFGVIAQACWMSSQSGGSLTVEQILAAKGSSDFSTIVLPDGSTPTNWGQLRKALLNKHQNAGQIVSGHAEPLTPPATEEPIVMTTDQTHGNKNHQNNQGKGHVKHDK